MQKNTWTLERLKSFIGQEEHYQLEFKSSRGILQQTPKSFFDELSKDVSAFLNSEGGILIIGLDEEKRDEKTAGKALCLSDGIRRSKLTASQLSSAICDRIHPSVSSYVQVFPVPVGQIDGEELLAFVVEVAQGITAYQAADWKYHARRSFGTVPMEDKDIRLRMLADEKPRGQLRFEVEHVSPNIVDVERFRRDADARKVAGEEGRALAGRADPLTDEEQAHYNELFLSRPTTPPTPALTILIRIILVNTGVVTIREGAVSGAVELANMGTASALPRGRSMTSFQLGLSDGVAPYPLYPDMERAIAEWTVTLNDRDGGDAGDVWLRNVSVFLDNGPSVTRNEDIEITEKFRSAVEAGWGEWERIFNG